MRPQIRAAAIGCKRQIVIQPDLQALPMRMFLCCGKLAVNMPLNPFVEENQLLSVYRGIVLSLGNWGPVVVGPIRPDPDIRILLDGSALPAHSKAAIAVEEVAFGRECSPEIPSGQGRDANSSNPSLRNRSFKRPKPFSYSTYSDPRSVSS